MDRQGDIGLGASWNLAQFETDQWKIGKDAVIKFDGGNIYLSWPHPGRLDRLELSYWVVNVSVHGLKIRPDRSLSLVVKSEHVQLL